MLTCVKLLTVDDTTKVSPSTAPKMLTFVPFTTAVVAYAAAGRLAASGQARLHGQKAAASHYAPTRAKAGSRFLVRAGKRLR